ncbi:hypothetical protein RN001_005560 [Aquatica leii]|uniref:Mutator-like transposase domain-containing protein n=1 Tax=Aquatica leii TaxID=1421715 RepID=A0AAN7SAM9_9COLE|nr:hypothetical protein RN001_005560 [Aquatica leii]
MANSTSVIEYHTEDPTKKKSLKNYGAVWGTLATGSTLRHLQEFLSCMDVSPMPVDIFYKLENLIEKDWRDSLWKSMEATGINERNHAIKNGQVTKDGIPWITVYVDELIEDVVNNFMGTGRLVNVVNPEGSTIEDSEHSSGDKESSRFRLLYHKPQRVLILRERESLMTKLQNNCHIFP